MQKLATSNAHMKYAWKGRGLKIVLYVHATEVITLQMNENVRLNRILQALCNPIKNLKRPPTCFMRTEHTDRSLDYIRCVMKSVCCQLREMNNKSPSISAGIQIGLLKVHTQRSLTLRCATRTKSATASPLGQCANRNFILEPES